MKRIINISPLLFLVLTLTPVISSGQSNYSLRKHDISTSNFNEVAPIIYRNMLIFNSDKTTGSTTRRSDAENRPFFHMYMVEKNENGGWGNEKPFAPSLRTLLNDGPVSISGDGQHMVITRNFAQVGFGNNVRGNTNVGLFFADSTQDGWSNLREFRYNDANALTTHPSMDSSGTSLFFASNREGGFGGFDLYVSRNVDGRWQSPQNLGPSVNTAGNEIFPFIHPSGRLYFSSDGIDNIRGYDIYYTDFFNGKWYTPVILPPRFNSSRDDFTYYIDSDYRAGFLTSNRNGTMDIFEFETSLPSFDVCRKQVENNYCYVFFEENTVSLDTTLYHYEWNMGDGVKVRAIEAEHCYQGPGDYLIQLNVVDKLTGIVQFNQAEYLVEVRKVIQPYIMAPDTVRMNEEVTFSATETYLGDAEPAEFYWEYGDGNKNVGANTQHIFLSPGFYQVKLGVIEVSSDPETARRFCAYKSIVVTE